MGPNTKLHDGIVGLLLVLGSLLAYFVHPLYAIIPGAIGLTMLQSAFSGFCPVYYTLGKIRKTS